MGGATTAVGSRPRTVTVVAVGELPPGVFGAASAALPGVRLLAGTDDPRRGRWLVERARPQVVLAGLGRDRDAVLAVVAELVARPPGVPVLAVSVTDVEPPADVLAAVRAGVTGYLLVPAGPDGGPALADALRRTAVGEAVFSPGLAEVVLEEHGRPASLVPTAGPARLTARETDVLRLVVEGLTARQIATRLVLSPRTVENHIQRMLRRLDLPNRAALVRHAIENGLA